MKRTLAVIAALAALIALQAPAYATENGDTVISMQNVNEGDVTVGVPTVRRADGSVCVGYISSASYEDNSDMRDVRVGRICGMPRHAGESTPAQLVSMGTFTSAGLTVNTPTMTRNDFSHP